MRARACRTAEKQLHLYCSATGRQGSVRLVHLQVRGRQVAVQLPQSLAETARFHDLHSLRVRAHALH
jgi:hypothetical protein